MENSNCHDYVTEKLYAAFEAGVIPIVDGPDDYSAFMPSNHSIIEARQFESAQQLAEHLKYLIANRTAYMEYMEWKTGASFAFNEVFQRRMQPVREIDRHKQRLCTIASKAKSQYRNTSEIPDTSCVYGRFKPSLPMRVALAPYFYLQREAWPWIFPVELALTSLFTALMAYKLYRR
jgi:hypothetical protein